MFYQLQINRKYLKKLEQYLQNFGYTNYHYVYLNEYLIQFEVFMYETLKKYEFCLRKFSNELKVIE